MTEKDVINETIRVLKESTETEIEVTEETRLYEDIGISSVEAMILLSDLEDRFGVDIPTIKLRNIEKVGELGRLVIEILRAGMK